LAGKADREVLSENLKLGEALDPTLRTQNSELRTFQKRSKKGR